MARFSSFLGFVGSGLGSFGFVKLGKARNNFASLSNYIVLLSVRESDKHNPAQVHLISKRVTGKGFDVV